MTSSRSVLVILAEGNKPETVIDAECMRDWFERHGSEIHGDH